LLDGLLDRLRFTSAVWTSIMIGQVIQNEFEVKFHPGHVRKILKKMDYSMQKPKRIFARADEEQKKKWRRYTYPSVKKKLTA
jgi:transposase